MRDDPVGHSSRFDALVWVLKDMEYNAYGRRSGPGIVRKESPKQPVKLSRLTRRHYDTACSVMLWGTNPEQLAPTVYEEQYHLLAAAMSCQKMGSKQTADNAKSSREQHGAVRVMISDP